MVKVLSSPSPVLPSASLSQSGLMIAALLGGFVVFLAMQGKLGNYWSILMGGGASSTSTASTTTSPSTSTSPSTTTSPSTSTSPSTTATTTNPFGLPSSAFPMLGGTANPTATIPGGVGYNATTPGIFSGLTASPFFGGS
jgi:hypothetical protein